MITKDIIWLKVLSSSALLHPVETFIWLHPKTQAIISKQHWYVSVPHAQDLGELLSLLQSSLQMVLGFCPEKFCL